MILLCLLLLQDYDHPYLASKDLSVVRVLEVGKPVGVKREGWPSHEFRGTVKFQVEESFVGPKETGEKFTSTTIEYRLWGSDRPATPWDGVEIVVGSRFVFSPGPEFPRVLTSAAAPADLEEIRSILRLRQTPSAEQGAELRKLLRQPTLSPTLGAAARELVQKHPEIAMNAESIFEFLLKKDVLQEQRFLWAGVLNRLCRPSLDWKDEGNRKVCEVWWRILDRAALPAGEDPRLILHSINGLGDFIWALGATPPRCDDFLPASCSKERILQSVEYVRRNDKSRYMVGPRQLPEHPNLERLRRFLGP